MTSSETSVRRMSDQVLTPEPSGMFVGTSESLTVEKCTTAAAISWDVYFKHSMLR